MHNENTMSDAPAPAISETALDTRRPAILIHAVVPRGPQPPASPNCSHRPSRRQCSAPASAACVATLARLSSSARPYPHACVACAEKMARLKKRAKRAVMVVLSAGGHEELAGGCRNRHGPTQPCSGGCSRPARAREHVYAFAPVLAKRGIAPIFFRGTTRVLEYHCANLLPCNCM